MAFHFGLTGNGHKAYTLSAAVTLQFFEKQRFGGLGGGTRSRKAELFRIRQRTSSCDVVPEFL